MELRQLAYLVAVADEAHFTRAAQKTHIAQPAISRQVIQLERELGERLLVRDRTGVRLTDPGRAFLPHARAALAAAQAGRDALASLRGLLTGQLRIGTVLPGHDGLTALIGRYRHKHPGVELRLTEDHNRPLIRSVQTGELDLALIGLGPRLQLQADLQAEQVLAEPVVVAMTPDHPLAARRSLTLRQLADEAIVALPPGSGQREMLETLAPGFVPRITAESSDIRLLIELAAQGVGIAFVPLSAVTANDSVAAVPISRPRLERWLFLIWQQPTLSPAARAWLDQARTELTRPTLIADRPSS
jgi:DNA-binding transcriptional LysR family regulator